MNKLLFIISFCMLAYNGYGQGALNYQEPPKEIKELVDAPLAPSVIVDSKGENVILLYRNAYKTIAELSEEELRIGGLRINPKTNIGSRTTYFNNVKLKKAFGTEVKEVSGLPENPRLSNFAISPNEKMVACTNTTETGVEIWVLDIENASVKKITETNVNANMGRPMAWFNDGSAMLVRMLPSNRKELVNTQTAVPTGPTVTVSSGAKAQNRTYQDLLKNPVDENNFEALAMSDIYKVSLDGTKTKWKETGMYRGTSFSPDGKYVLVTEVKRPFSYLVPYYRFASETTIYDADGNKVKILLDNAVDEVRPKGFMATTDKKRGFSWRNDKPATITWVQALDGGDPAKEVEFHDEVFEMPAPFNGTAKSLVKVKNRLSYIQWGNDEVAIAHDQWFDNRNTKSYVFNPSDIG